MRLFLCILLITICASLCAGCSDPVLNLSVASQPNVNPDHSGRASPVIVKMYELRSDVAFKQADFQALFNTPIQVLGADLVAFDEIVFIPGEARHISYTPNINTKFVGVLAGFRQMDRALWRITKSIDAEDKTWLAFELNDASIVVQPDSDAEDWDPEKAVREFHQQSVKQQDQSTAGADNQAMKTRQTAGANPDAKETITVINQDGVETVQDPNAQASTSPSTRP